MTKSKAKNTKSSKTYTSRSGKSAELRRYNAGAASHAPYHSLGVAYAPASTPKR